MKNKGFTLVELLVVITIIAVLTLIGLTIYTSAQKAARDGKRRADLEAIAKALEQYKSANGKYPIADIATAKDVGSDRSGWLSNSTTDGDLCDNCNHPLGNLVKQGMMKEVPRDPSKNANNAGTTCDNDDVYAYGTDSTGQSYTLGAVLETSTGSCNCTFSFASYEYCRKSQQ